MKFELKKDSSNRGAVNVETVIDFEGKNENSGEVQILFQGGLDDCEQHNELPRKRSGADFFGTELPRKKIQVSYDAQNKTFEVAGAGNQSRQEP